MKSQSHVTLILVLVVVLVALVSAYAWFSAGVQFDYHDVITTGSVTSISITDIDASDIENKYSGQKGFQLVDNTYVAYAQDNVEAPYNVYLNQSYQASASNNITLRFILSKAVIELPNSFSRNLAWILSNSFGVDTTAQDYDYTKYYSTAENVVPTGNTSGFYAVGASTSTIRKIVLMDSAVNNYFYFDYWAASSLSDATTAATALTYPIELIYGQTIAQTPVTNYVRLHLGYYGKVLDSNHTQYGQYVMPFIFNATQYSGSTFVFTINVEA